MIRLNSKFEEEVLKNHYNLNWDDCMYYKDDFDGGFLAIGPDEMVGVLLRHFYQEERQVLNIFYGESRGDLWSVYYYNYKLPNYQGHVEGDTLLCALANMIEEIYHASN